MVIYQDFLNTCDPFCRGYDSLTYFQDLVGIYNLHHKWFNKPYFVCRLYFFKSWNFSINWYEFIWKLTRITIVVHANRIEWHLVVGLSWNNLALSRNSQLPPQVCQYLNLMILNQLRQLLIQSKDIHWTLHNFFVPLNPGGGLFIGYLTDVRVLNPPIHEKITEKIKCIQQHATKWTHVFILRILN